MKLFKSVDKKFNEIGFIKTEESNFGVYYERPDKEFKYVQELCLLHKANGNHLIQSSQKEVNKDGYNNMVGLSMYEAKLSLKKMKQIGWKVTQ